MARWPSIPMTPYDLLELGIDASHTRRALLSTAKASKAETNGFLSSSAYFTIEQLGTDYYKMTPVTGLHHSVNGVGYLRFSFASTDGANLIITKNEPIE